jgi:excisionase family DNA binding protein
MGLGHRHRMVVPRRRHRAHGPTPGRLLDIEQAAEYLGVEERWLKRDRSDYLRIPYHRVGRLVRYDPRDLDAYLAANRVEAGGR